MSAVSSVPVHSPLALDELGVVIALMAVGALALPMALARANRIVAGEGKLIWDALPPVEAALVLVVVAGVAALALVRSPLTWRLLASLGVLALLAIEIGRAASFL